MARFYDLRTPQRLLLRAIRRLDQHSRLRHFQLDAIESAYTLLGGNARDMKSAIRRLYRQGYVRGVAGKYGLTPSGRALVSRL